MLANHNKGFGFTCDRADDTHLALFTKVFSAIGTKVSVDANQEFGRTGLLGSLTVAHDCEGAAGFDDSIVF